MLTDDELGAAAWAVEHLIEKHGYSSIVGRDNSRVSLKKLLKRLLTPGLLAEHDRAVAEAAAKQALEDAADDLEANSVVDDWVIEEVRARAASISTDKAGEATDGDA